MKRTMSLPGIAFYPCHHHRILNQLYIVKRPFANVLIPFETAKEIECHTSKTGFFRPLQIMTEVAAVPLFCSHAKALHH